MEDRPSTTFADVAGVDEAKSELEEVVEFLKTPQKFQRLGGKIPKGVLLVGPPGTGKTLLARAVAGEAGVPFFSMSGSEFVEVLVGVGASRVRDLFDQAKKAAPSIIFIDEIDAVGRQRGTSLTTNDEREQTLNQLLVEMDGFDSRQAVVVIAATNRPDNLDQALLRPGRFDRRVTVDRPDWKGRQAILMIHSRGVPLAQDVDLQQLARMTTGMVGADLANLVNEAALLAARRNLDAVNMRCFYDALDRIQLGAERPLVLSEEDLRVVAIHEADIARRPADAALRSGDQGDHRAAWPGAGCHAVYADGRPLQLLEGLSLRADHDGARRARRGGGSHRQHHDRRRERPPAGHDDRAQHGRTLGYGHEGRPDLLSATGPVRSAFRATMAQREYWEETAALIDEEAREIIEDGLPPGRQACSPNIRRRWSVSRSSCAGTRRWTPTSSRRSSTRRASTRKVLEAAPGVEAIPGGLPSGAGATTNGATTIGASGSSTNGSSSDAGQLDGGTPDLTPGIQP